MTAVWVAEVDLATSAVPAGVSRACRPDDDAARILVRSGRQVLGFLTVPVTAGEVAPAVVLAAVESELGHRVAALADSGGRQAAPVDLSVVVCSRERPAILRTCLERLRGIDYPGVEFVIVDNAPTTDQTRTCFETVVGDDARFRYVREAAPGLSRARNRGLAEASHRHVAFTDDDVQVDRWWLDGIAAGFAGDSSVGCVTGLVPPAELEHPTQHYFDRRYSWARAMDRRVYDLASRRDDSILYPYSAGIFGTGANFAVDRSLLLELGGFDEALGAGSPAQGGEDLDAFVRVLLAGRRLVYEPSAIVWHVHRAGDDALRRQLFGYGLGLTAFLTKYVIARGTRRDIMRRLPAGARRIPRLWSAEEIAGPAPRSLVLAEALGMLAGPRAYLRGRRYVRRAPVDA
jgi:GT2 family glycosyltransferase